MWVLRILVSALVILTLMGLFLAIIPFIPGVFVHEDTETPLSAGERAPFMVIGIVLVLFFIVMWGFVIAMIRDL